MIKPLSFCLAACLLLQANACSAPMMESLIACGRNRRSKGIS